MSASKIAYYRRMDPTTTVLQEGRLTDKYDHRVGHFNTILARVVGYFNGFDPGEGGDVEVSI